MVMKSVGKRALYPFVFLRPCLCYCFFQLSAWRVGTRKLSPHPD